MEEAENKENNINFSTEIIIYLFSVFSNIFGVTPVEKKEEKEKKKEEFN